jgi:hypothetical protein
MANSSINPFYISQSEYDDIEDGETDGWDGDGYSWNDNDRARGGAGAGGVEQEQRRLMSGPPTSLSVGTDQNNNRGRNASYSLSFGSSNHPQKQQRHHNQYHNHGGSFHNSPPDASVAAVKTFHRQGSPYDYRHNGSPAWTVSLVVGVVFVFVVIIASGDGNNRSSHGNEKYESLIDYAPDDSLRLVVLGERHSGVSWMKARLHECFPHADVSSVLQREGFLFQDETDMKFSKHTNNKDPIVVMMTLNVYDWLEHMRIAPEFSPNHTKRHSEYGHMVPLDFEDFVSRPWTMERPEQDFPLANNTKGRICQERFRFNEIVSCAAKGSVVGTDNPMYEMQQDGSGSPFASIMDLRASKLRNHYNVKDWTDVKKFDIVPYELAGQLFKDLVKDIQQFTEWQLSCTGDVLPPSKDRSASMTRSFVDYITKNADWEAEGLIATYKPWTDSEIDSKQIEDESPTNQKSDGGGDDKQDSDHEMPRETNGEITKATVPTKTAEDDEEASESVDVSATKDEEKTKTAEESKQTASKSRGESTPKASTSAPSSGAGDAGTESPKETSPKSSDNNPEQSATESQPADTKDNEKDDDSER